MDCLFEKLRIPDQFPSLFVIFQNSRLPGCNVMMKCISLVPCLCGSFIGNKTLVKFGSLDYLLVLCALITCVSCFGFWGKLSLWRYLGDDTRADGILIKTDLAFMVLLIW
jgi:hypothetical protein